MPLDELLKLLSAGGDFSSALIIYLIYRNEQRINDVADKVSKLTKRVINLESELTQENPINTGSNHD